MTEEDVFEEAYGFGISSAYSLVYFSEKLLNSAASYVDLNSQII